MNKLKHSKNLIKLIYNFKKFYYFKYLSDVDDKNYLIFKTVYYEFLKKKNLVKYNKFKNYCLYTFRKRSILTKYKMSRHILKKNLDNLNLN